MLNMVRPPLSIECEAFAGRAEEASPAERPSFLLDARVGVKKKAENPGF
jgi:hypothetical protein